MSVANPPVQTEQQTTGPEPGVRVGPIGLAWRPRVLAMTVVALVVAVVVAVLALGLGSAHLSPLDVLRTLAGHGEGAQEFIIMDVRLPRVLVALLVGVALSVAGALTQTFARNPLATPDILGVTSGASLGAVTVIAAAGGTSLAPVVANLGVPAAATAGALVAAALVFALGWRGGLQSYRVVLVGIGITAVLDALTSYQLVRAKVTIATAASQWLVGSLSGVSWQSVWPLLVVVVLAVPLALACSRSVAAAQLGDEVAWGIGVHVTRLGVAVGLLAVVLSAGAVAAAGPVGFVAFVVPQIAVRIAGTSRPPLLLSALLGAALVTGADLLGRILLPNEVPVGIITTIVGAPYLIWLLVRHSRELAS